MTERIAFQVAGVSFRPGYPDNLLRLHDIEESQQHPGEGTVAVLERDPDNPHDPNAVKVMVPALGDDGHVGFVPKDLAPEVGTLIQGRYRLLAEISTRVHPDHPDRPGADVLVLIET